jgi:hypothetical protein
MPSPLNACFACLLERSSACVFGVLLTCKLLQLSSAATRVKPLYMQAASSSLSLLGCHFNRHTPPPVGTCRRQQQQQQQQQQQH